MNGPTRGPITNARVDAAREARMLVHSLVAADADDEVLTAITGLLADANALLADVARLPRPAPDFAGIHALRARDRARAEEPMIHAMADRAVAGPANATSVDIRTRFAEGGVEADVCFGPAFEGAPGRVHGGIVAAVFDDLLGSAMAEARSPGFTGRLTVHYRAPVPIERVVRFRAWRGAHEGRKLHVHADVRLDDRVLASADALMILVDLDHFTTRADDLLDRSADAG